MKEGSKDDSSGNSNAQLNRLDEMLTTNYENN